MIEIVRRCPLLDDVRFTPFDHLLNGRAGRGLRELKSRRPSTLVDNLLPGGLSPQEQQAKILSVVPVAGRCRLKSRLTRSRGDFDVQVVVSSPGAKVAVN